jgi:MoaA/NifB/PqqE/SkfB family radical SAM enzyme
MNKDLKQYVLEADYQRMAGSSWPSYTDYVAGAQATDQQVQREIDEFTKQQIQTGVKSTRAEFNTIYNTKYKPADFDIEDNDLVYRRKVFNLPSVKTDIKHVCYIPWYSAVVDVKGRVYICYCDGYLPYSVGKITDFDSFDQVFNNPTAIEIQQSVKNKEYTYCATEQCGTKYNPMNIMPINMLYLAIQTDISCNISCPSCRERMIFLKDEAIIDEQYTWAQRIKLWIESTKKTVTLEFAGGDPFASIIYKRMIELFAELPNVKFNIKTNGLLIKSHFKMIEQIKDRTAFNISIDAATKETYEQVRRGGTWDQLLDNLELHRSLGKRGTGNFVIQRLNFREVIPFIKMCNKYNMGTTFCVLHDWGTYDNYEEHCVHLPGSPDYEEFKQIMQDPAIKEYNANISMVQSWL